MIRISIVGATGYTGRELLRYLLGHPEAEIVHCTSESFPGKAVASVHSDLVGRFDLMLEKLNVQKVAEDSDVVFLCLPHGNSAKAAEQFLKRGVRVVDLSADFRLRSSALYQKWYNVRHPVPSLLKEAVYGLPEIYREEIKKANLVANPGCYAAAAILTALPLVRAGCVHPGSIIIDAKSGVSGAGKKLENRYLFCEENENFLAYGVQGHRHAPEIEQELNRNRSIGKRSSGMKIKKESQVTITFVPHLLPVTRGILVTVYAGLKKEITERALAQSYSEFYGEEPFVSVLPQGSFPQLKSVQNSNFCQIGLHLDKKNKRVVAIGVIDNLGKGASGQAVQNMNLMFQVDERCGLV